MPLTLYYSAGSSQSQAIQMVAAALQLDLHLKPVNLAAREHLSAEFLALNPQHTIPTLVDGEFAVWETRAILVYLVEQYGGVNNSLYPADPKQRATINQRLYFDMGTLYQRFATSFFVAFRTKKPVEAAELEKVEAAFGFLDAFLEGEEFVAGKQLTVADIALFTTVSLFELVQFDWSRWANVQRWYAKLRETVPGREINEAGMEAARKHFANK